MPSRSISNHLLCSSVDFRERTMSFSISHPRKSDQQTVLIPMMGFPSLEGSKVLIYAAACFPRQSVSLINNFHLLPLEKLPRQFSTCSRQRSPRSRHLPRSHHMWCIQELVRATEPVIVSSSSIVSWDDSAKAVRMFANLSSQLSWARSKETTRERHVSRRYSV